MPRRTKTERYQDIKSLPNVSELLHFGQGEFASVRGYWAQVFGNDHPIILEMACGKGEYAIELARRYPDRNFLGIDIKGDRIWKGAQRAIEDGLTNVHFLRTRIDHIENYFAPGEVNEIWITFPDPYHKKSKKRKRLTHPVFLKRFAGIMQQNGIIHLKTDSDRLFDFTLKIIDIYDLPISAKVTDVYKLSSLPHDLDIQTYYEKQHLSAGKTIKYVAFELNDLLTRPLPPAIDKLN